MLRTRTLLTIVVLSLLFAAFAACGGGGEEKATPTSTKPAGATPTQTAVGTPTGPTFSGNATATVKVGDKTLTFKNGKCDIAPDNTWLAVNIGQASSDEYFGLLVGTNPSAPGGARPVSGGGVFTDGEIVLSGTQGGSTFIMGGIGAAAAANKVTLAADLKSGEFEGATLEGERISGSFKC
jgi:hypothetical protein